MMTLEDEHFGTCPECGKLDGVINIGKGQWGYCAEHKTKWFAGSNLVSTWKLESEEEQRAAYDALGFREFREVGRVSACAWRGVGCSPPT